MSSESAVPTALGRMTYFQENVGGAAGNAYRQLRYALDDNPRSLSVSRTLPDLEEGIEECLIAYFELLGYRVRVSPEDSGNRWVIETPLLFGQPSAIPASRGARR